MREGLELETADVIRENWALAYNLVGRAVESTPAILTVLHRTVAETLAGPPSDFGHLRARLLMTAVQVLRTADRTALAPRTEPVDSLPGFAARTMLQVWPSGQRREAVEATRWIVDDERALLSLWWLEVAGQLSRSELDAVLGLPTTETAVVVREIEARFEDARAVVRALGSNPRCPGLADVVAHWDGEPSVRCRQRIARHVHDCAACRDTTSDLIPADRLLRGFPLVPPPRWLTERLAPPSLPAAPATRPSASPLVRLRVTGALRVAAAAVVAAVVTIGLLSYARGDAEPTTPADAALDRAALPSTGLAATTAPKITTLAGVAATRQPAPTKAAAPTKARGPAAPNPVAARPKPRKSTPTKRHHHATRGNHERSRRWHHPRGNRHGHPRRHR
ncbi:hypothetical protein [Cryptosporangium arvum]|uniref:hypothetical protein n=1 Tax=Cryptosporangium arvum TaxID=80871 RepID=UPI0004B7CDDA|nr:hypothetical protein [Cryptosporangium arvum]